MSVDIARLVIEIDSSAATPAEKSMDALIAKGAQLEATAKRVKTATDHMNAGHQGAIGAVQKATQATMGLVAAQGAVEKATLAADRAAEKSAQQAFAFRVRMAKQRAAEEAAEAKAGAAAQAAADRQAEASGQQLLAFRMRMARQRAAEDVAADKVSAKAAADSAKEQATALASLERRIFALKSAIDPTYAAQSRLDAEMKEAQALYKMGAISASDYAARVSQLDAEMAAAARGQTMFNGVLIKGAANSRFMQRAGLDLSRQFADIGVTAALGLSPLLILIQQGPQIADIFIQAKMQGLGFSAMMKGLAATTWAALAPLLPFIAAAAAVAAVLGSGVALAARAVNKENGDLTKGLGLTADQLEKVKNKGVTMGDVLRGTFNYLGKAAGPILKPVADWFSHLFDSITSGAVRVIKFLVGGFIGAFEAVKATWRMLPAAMADLTATAVNAVLASIERMINWASDKLNALIEKANAGAKAVGIEAKLPTLGRVAIPRIDNPNAGAAARVADVGSEAFAAGMAKGEKMVDSVLRGLGESIVDAAIKRIKKEAGKGPKTAAAPRDQTDERTAQLDGMLAQARADELQARLAMAKEVQERADLEKQVLAAEYQKKQADIARQAANIEDDKGLTDAKKLELLGQLKIVEGLEKQTTALRARAVDDAATDALAKQSVDLANADRDSRASVLQAQLELTTTAAKRGEIEMELLRLGDERVKAELEGVIAARGSTATQVAIAQAQLDALEASKADREKAAQKKTAIAGADEIISELGQIDALAVQAGQSLGAAFGNAGDALGGLLANLTGFRVQMAQITREQLSGEKTVQQAARARAAVQIKTYGDMAGAAKGFFKEGSAGYKALEIAETAYRLIQFANSVQAVFLKGAETAATVTGAATETTAVVGAETAKTAATAAGTAVRTPLKVSEGAASMFAALGPLGFPVVAAMLAVMAGLGFRGHGGGGSVNVTEERQKRQGAGSVLGDASAKSESIAHALEIVASNTNRDLEYSNDMLRALRSIDTNIGALTAQLAKELNVGGALDTSGLNLGTTSSGPGLIQRILNPISNILPGLFGTKTTTNLLDQGIQFAPQTVGGISAGGLEGDSYQTTQTTKKKKLFGVVVSNKTSTNTATQGLDQDIIDEMQRVIGSLRDGVLAAASSLGIEGAKATLDAFSVNLGQISFTGKTGEEIGAELEAVFSKLGDQMAEAAVPGLSAMQKAGEGAFETLARVAREYQVVDVALQSIGKSFGSVGLASLAARDDLVQLFGSLDDFASATQAFADNFLSEAERMAPIQKAVQDQLARLGVSGVNTKDQFKELVLAQDLTTASGREMYAQLLAVGPAFAKVADYLAQGSKEIQEARDALSAAYERESEALQGTIDRFRQFAASLAEFRESLYTGPAALLSPEDAYNASKAKFEDVSTRAAAGDEKALEDLQNVSQAYLDASRTYYASSGAYFADLAKVRTAVEAAETTATHTADTATQQLDALKASVSGLIDINESVISVHDAIVNLQSLLAAQAGSSATPFSPVSPAGSPAPATTTATDSTGATDAYTTPGFGDYGTPVAVNDNTGAADPYGGAYGGSVPMDYSGLTGNLQPLDLMAPLDWERQFGDPMMQRFATGSAFSNGVVSKPTAFDIGQMGEAGDEGILPLANIGGKLGVYSTGAGGGDQETKDLLQRVIDLLAAGNENDARVAEAITSTDTANTARIVRAMQDQGSLDRLTNGGEAA